MNAVSSNRQYRSATDELNAAIDRLADRVSVSKRRLSQRLDALYEAHNLTASQLWDSQRKIARMHNTNSAPSPTEFWTDTAEPWARMLTTTCISAINDEFSALTDSTERFIESIAIANGRGANITNNEVRSILNETLTEQIQAARPSSAALDSLGVAWHARLNRAAWRKSFPVALFKNSAESETYLTKAQVELVSRGPWAHSDRLLSAFEGAHADIREHLTDCLAKITTVHPSPVKVSVLA